MTLLTRLIAPLPGEVKLPVHQFMGELAEIRRGESTRAQLISEFNLSTPEETQLDLLIAQMAADNVSRAEVHDVLLLGEYGLRTEAQVLTRFGF